MRDQLRQAARTWDEHDRSDDLLWTGSAYREFAVWRERYPGGLTETEQDFAERHDPPRQAAQTPTRVAVAATFVVAAGGAGVVGGFWRRSVTEARRAEAANLFSLAQLQLEDHPSAAIAYAIASLELADSPEVRRLALEALWRGPTELRLPTRSPYSARLQPRRPLARHRRPEGGARLWPSDGGPPTALEGSDVAMEIRFSPSGDLVAANMDMERRQMGFWSGPGAGFCARSPSATGAHHHSSRSRATARALFTNTEILGRDRTSS